MGVPGFPPRTGKGCHGNLLWVDISPRRGFRYLDSKRFIFPYGPPAGPPLLELPAFLSVKAARLHSINPRGWLCLGYAMRDHIKRCAEDHWAYLKERKALMRTSHPSYLNTSGLYPIQEVAILCTCCC